MEKKLHPDSVELLVVLQKTMTAANYSHRSIPTYTREVRFVCAYYPDLSPHQWTDAHIIDYMAYLKLVHKVSYSKSKMVAQSVAFFFRHVHYHYHSCHNRHCPSCNWQRQDEWQEARMNELLPVKYFHTVFTIPHELNPLVMGNRSTLFKLLFDSASYCLLKLCKDTKWLGAVPAITAVLHTWGQQLSFHPHVHCIVSGGGADKNHQWHNLKKSVKYGYLFPYHVMEPVYKGYFLEQLNIMVKNARVRLPTGSNWPLLRDSLYKQKWIVYAKQPRGACRRWWNTCRVMHTKSPFQTTVLSMCLKLMYAFSTRTTTTAKSPNHAAYQN